MTRSGVQSSPAAPLSRANRQHNRRVQTPSSSPPSRSEHAIWLWSLRFAQPKYKLQFALQCLRMAGNCFQKDLGFQREQKKSPKFRPNFALNLPYYVNDLLRTCYPAQVRIAVYQACGPSTSWGHYELFIKDHLHCSYRVFRRNGKCCCDRFRRRNRRRPKFKLHRVRLPFCASGLDRRHQMLGYKVP